MAAKGTDPKVFIRPVAAGPPALFYGLAKDAIFANKRKYLPLAISSPACLLSLVRLPCLLFSPLPPVFRHFHSRRSPFSFLQSSSHVSRPPRFPACSPASLPVAPANFHQISQPPSPVPEINAYLTGFPRTSPDVHPSPCPFPFTLSIPSLTLSIPLHLVHSLFLSLIPPYMSMICLPTGK